jgi:DNA-binding NarL/FixJ family response regulator
VSDDRRTRLLLVDDHALVAEGFRGLLEPDFEVVGIVSDPANVVSAFRRLRPDVVLMDITLPGKSGLALTDELRSRWPGVRVLMLTMHGEAGFVDQARKVGARGFVLKLAEIGELRRAIRVVAEGETYFSPALIAQDATSRCPLTPRQMQVLKLLATGYTAPQIAERLQIGTKTVEFHRSEVRRILQLRTSAALVRYAIDHGILE